MPRAKSVYPQSARPSFEVCHSRPAWLEGVSRTALQDSTDRLRVKRSLAPGPSVASAEIQGASPAPSQAFSGLPSRIAKSYSCLLLEEAGSVRLYLAHRLLDLLARRRLLLFVGHAFLMEVGVRHLVGDRLIGHRRAE